MDSGVFADMSNADKLSYACGGIVVAGLLYLILALIIKLVGVKKVMRFLPPVVTGPIIICIGLSLAGSAINNASTNWLLALIALVTIIVFNIWGRGMFKIIPILMGVIISYIAALIFNAMGMTNADGSAILSFTDIANASWVGVPAFSLCKFNLSAILVMAPIALATMMEHIGDISAISATVDQNFIEDPGLHRTLIGDGLATSLSALVGGPANTTYGENTGVLELSKVYDPKVIRIAACYAIILSFIPKMAAVIGSMPSAIIGGVSFMLYGMISAIGVSYLPQNTATYITGGQPMVYPEIAGLTKTVTIAGTPTKLVVLITPILVILLVVGLTQLINHTKVGMAMRAVSVDFETAQLMGIKINSVISFTFIIGSALAAVASFLYFSNYTTIAPASGALPGLTAFVAAALGGIGSVPGAVIGAFIIGLCENLIKSTDYTVFSDAFTFALLIVILVFKPTGLFGEKTTDKV